MSFILLKSFDILKQYKYLFLFFMLAFAMNMSISECSNGQNSIYEFFYGYYYWWKTQSFFGQMNALLLDLKVGVIRDGDVLLKRLEEILRGLHLKLHHHDVKRYHSIVKQITAAVLDSPKLGDTRTKLELLAKVMELLHSFSMGVVSK